MIDADGARHKFRIYVDLRTGKVKKITKNTKATSLDNAIALTKQYAKANRMPSKIMADLMGVELKTYYRWLLDGTMPLNRVPQFEKLSGAHYISEYLCVMHGNRVVINIPRGRKSKLDFLQAQAQVAESLALLAQFCETGEAVDETYAALTQTLSVLAYHRENVKKVEAPELAFGDEGADDE